jgi:hypothetical protein
MAINVLPVTHAVCQIIGGQDKYTESEVELALWEIDKPLQKITIHDVAQHIERQRNPALKSLGT